MSSRAEVISIPDHALLRVIGRGSYGEVWLARNVMGTLRAVKVVRRSAFDSDRPWLREFEGIRRCEPVSRAHDGLIDILHMGRHDEEGWFYYVMELADGADDSTDVESYRPATLAARLDNGARLEVSECLRIAESLAGALAFLHEQGLIHRDVKPSNLLYVGGMPKLGDIGLVAEAGSSRSFVGTEGFVPLEGPGTERADIYALGKVLYEALTGLDREKFPRLPEHWHEPHEFEQRLELNEIVLRACEGDLSRRYHTAREMLADVVMVASGRSVRKMRGMERRVRLLTWIAGSIALVALGALGVSALLQQQASREHALRIRAEKAEAAHREAKFDSLLDQVHAARRDPGNGAVTRALNVASEAAAVRVTPQLRDDAIFLLSRADFVPRPDLSFNFSHPCWGIDPENLVMAEMPYLGETPQEKIDITLHAAGAPEKKRLLTLRAWMPELSMLRFAHGGQRLLVTGKYGSGFVLDVASGEMLHPQPFAPCHRGGTPLAFLGEKGDAVVRRDSDGGLAIFSIPGGERRLIPPLQDWPLRESRAQGHRVWPSPDGRFILLIDTEVVLPGQREPILTGAACLVNSETGSIAWKSPGIDEQVAAWSPDGARIAVRRGDFIVTLSATNGSPASHVPQRIHGRGTELTFVHSRDVLAYSTWTMNGLCDMGREQMLGLPPVFGRWIYGVRRHLLLGNTGAAEWRPSPAMRIFCPRRSINFPVIFRWSPGEKWLIAGHGSAFSWWRIEDNASAPNAITPAHNAGDLLFSSDGNAMQLMDNAGRHEAAWTGTPLEELPDPLPYGPNSNGRSDYASASADGKTTAFGGDRYAIVRREGEAPRSFPADDISNPVSLSPDGRWLALGSIRSKHIRVFDLAGGSDMPMHVEETGSGSFPAFSPDGRWLACSSLVENRILEVGTWKVIHRRPCLSHLIGYISFSGDGRLIAVRDTLSSYAILEAGSWRFLFHLDSPLGEMFERASLSASGRYFAAVGTRCEIYVWDLEALRREFKSRGLGDIW